MTKKEFEIVCMHFYENPPYDLTNEDEDVAARVLSNNKIYNSALDRFIALLQPTKGEQ